MYSARKIIVLFKILLLFSSAFSAFSLQADEQTPYESSAKLESKQEKSAEKSEEKGDLSNLFLRTGANIKEAIAKDFRKIRKSSDKKEDAQNTANEFSNLTPLRSKIEKIEILAHKPTHAKNLVVLNGIGSSLQLRPFLATQKSANFDIVVEINSRRQKMLLPNNIRTFVIIINKPKVGEQRLFWE